jgi:hypothetical protein
MHRLTGGDIDNSAALRLVVCIVGLRLIALPDAPI